jgi:hypothetical protein
MLAASMGFASTAFAASCARAGTGGASPTETFRAVPAARTRKATPNRRGRRWLSKVFRRRSNRDEDCRSRSARSRLFSLDGAACFLLQRRAGSGRGRFRGSRLGRTAGGCDEAGAHDAETGFLGWGGDAEELAADPVDRDMLDWLREASSIWDKVAA